MCGLRPKDLDDQLQSDSFYEDPGEALPAEQPAAEDVYSDNHEDAEVTVADVSLPAPPRTPTCKPPTLTSRSSATRSTAQGRQAAAPSL